MAVNAISSIYSGYYSYTQIDVEYDEIKKKLAALGIESSGNKAIDKLKLEEAEFDLGLWGNESKVLYLGVSEWFSGDEEKFSVFLHELGHYIDTEKIGDDFGIYSGNRELREIFEKEIENFRKHSTTKQQTFIDYFIGDRGKSSAAETFAESNMLLSTPYTTRRAYYLQQNFPRTIAKIAELIKSDLQ